MFGQDSIHNIYLYLHGIYPCKYTSQYIPNTHSANRQPLKVLGIAYLGKISFGWVRTIPRKLQHTPLNPPFPTMKRVGKGCPGCVPTACWNNLRTMACNKNHPFYSPLISRISNLNTQINMYLHACLELMVFMMFQSHGSIWAMKQIWLFRVYRGWNPTQLCGDFNKTF